MNCQVCGQANVEEARFCASCGAVMPARNGSESDPLVGQVIGNRYRITGVIGEGGMGVVYVGEQQMGSTIRKVAVKTLHPHLSKDENVLKRFHRECGTVAQLEHPNTIKVYDFGSTPDGTLYIAMEFVAGKSLSDVLQKEQRLSSDRVVQILRQVCGALDEAHQLGIVHRDLKPDNIILTQRAGEQDFVKVLDFGIAARTESADAAREQKLTQQGTVLGTPPYMSPEQFTGKALDRRSDIYSLGVMTYEMLTGKLPFEAETPWQWATQHMTVPPMAFEAAAPNVQLSEPIRQAILRALAKDREQRQTSAGQFMSELAKAAPVTTPASAVGFQATAAMPEMPNFAAVGGTAPLPTASIPQSPGGLAPGSVPANAYAMAGTPGPMIASPRKGGGGKTGLILGLSGAGVAIAAVMVVSLMRSNKPADEPLTTANNSQPIATANSSAAPATLAPEIPTAAAPTQMAPELTPPPPVESHEKGGHRMGKTTTSTTTANQSAPSPKPSAARTPNAPSNQTPAPTNDACAACVKAAAAQDFSGAARHYAACSDPGGKAQCSSTARGMAVPAAKVAFITHDCNKVRSIAAAIASMGISSPPIQNAANDCN